MLKGIDPLLSGDLLKVLDDMGHGDTLLLVDRNYPAASSGRPVVRLGEVSVVRAAQAILSVMPLDAFTEYPLLRMEVDNDHDRTTPTQDAVLEVARLAHDPSMRFGVVARPDFYERARSAFAVVHTLDDTPYACFEMHKGVILDS